MSKEPTQKELTKQVHQGLFGVNDTDDKGLVGDVKLLIQHVDRQNGRIRKLEISVAMIIGTGVLGYGGYGIVQLLSS